MKYYEVVSLYLLLASTRTSSIEIVADSIGVLTLGMLLVLLIKDACPFITRWYRGISFDNVIVDFIGIFGLGILLAFLTKLGSCFQTFCSGHHFHYIVKFFLSLFA